MRPALKSKNGQKWMLFHFYDHNFYLREFEWWSHPCWTYLCLWSLHYQRQIKRFYVHAAALRSLVISHISWNNEDDIDYRGLMLSFYYLPHCYNSSRRIYRGAVNLILFRQSPSKIFWKCSESGIMCMSTSIKYSFLINQCLCVSSINKISWSL